MDRNTVTNPNRSFCRTLTAGVVGLAMLALTPLSAEAKGRGMREPSPDRAVARLTERLDLTEEQQVQVRQILEESFDQRREIWDEGRASRDAVREQMETLKQETDDRLAEVLNEQQIEESQKLDQERVERREGRRGRRFDR
jgi:Spy/CpxP family protein refolding chaperone